ncbi:putative inorganic carbon transporter subunit DabA, partial [Nitrosomonas europaea]|uniref:putative inorganic carbon transporter subunit DabA n=1 Tax=Nitrosomonas europaea TaxID=915 RepID=UPI002C61499E
MVDVLNLGKILRVHATAYVAAEPVPLFWPMRTFIHNNPLHGLEGLPFTEAVQAARGLFHARVYLPRTTYQRYLREDKCDVRMLDAITVQFAQTAPGIDGIDWQRWL